MTFESQQLIRVPGNSYKRPATHAIRITRIASAPVSQSDTGVALLRAHSRRNRGFAKLELRFR